MPLELARRELQIRERLIAFRQAVLREAVLHARLAHALAQIVQPIPFVPRPGIHDEAVADIDAGQDETGDCKQYKRQAGCGHDIHH